MHGDENRSGYLQRVFVLTVKDLLAQCLWLPGHDPLLTGVVGLVPGALGWAWSHPGNTLDLCRGYRDWL